MTSNSPSSTIGTITKIAMSIGIIALAMFVFLQWESFIAKTLEWQKSLHGMLAEHIAAVSENALQYGGALVGLSFAYGVFHAVGPGHGKAVIVTYLGTQKETVFKGVVISFLAALLQSLMAIALVSGLAMLLKFKLSDIHAYGDQLALVSYIMVMILGAVIATGGIRRLIKQSKGAKTLAESGHKIVDDVHSDHEHHFHDHHSHDHHTHDHHTHDHHSHDHHSHDYHSHDYLAHDHHGDACGCSHTHVPSEQESLWQTMGVILSMGLRPCSGAIVVLIYAHLVGVYSYGVLATLMMGIGTGLSVSVIAVVTVYARSWIERWVNLSDGAHLHGHQRLSHLVRCTGGVVLVALGWSLFHAASVINVGSHPLF